MITICSWMIGTGSPWLHGPQDCTIHVAICFSIKVVPLLGGSVKTHLQSLSPYPHVAWRPFVQQHAKWQHADLQGMLHGFACLVPFFPIVNHGGLAPRKCCYSHLCVGLSFFEVPKQNKERIRTRVHVIGACNTMETSDMRNLEE